MSDYPMLISNKLHSFRNFIGQKYENKSHSEKECRHIFQGFGKKISQKKTTAFRFFAGTPLFLSVCSIAISNYSPRKREVPCCHPTMLQQLHEPDAWHRQPHPPSFPLQQ